MADADAARKIIIMIMVQKRINGMVVKVGHAVSTVVQRVAVPSPSITQTIT